MASLPSSGQLASSNLTSTFGSDGSPQSSDYYRGGRIPDERTTGGGTVYGDWSDSIYEPLGIGKTYVTFVDDGFSGYYDYYWDGVLVASTTQSSANSGGYQYERRASQGGGDYSIRRRTVTETSPSTESINTGVPTSGQLTSSDWYGAETA